MFAHLSEMALHEPPRSLLAPGSDWPARSSSDDQPMSAAAAGYYRSATSLLLTPWHSARQAPAARRAAQSTRQTDLGSPDCAAPRRQSPHPAATPASCRNLARHAANTAQHQNARRSPRRGRKCERAERMHTPGQFGPPAISAFAPLSTKRERSQIGTGNGVRTGELPIRVDQFLAIRAEKLWPEPRSWGSGDVACQQPV